MINSKENLSKEPLLVSVAKNPSQSLCDSSPLRASQDLPLTQGEVASQNAMTERATWLPLRGSWQPKVV